MSKTQFRPKVVIEPYNSKLTIYEKQQGWVLMSSTKKEQLHPFFISPLNSLKHKERFRFQQQFSAYVWLGWKLRLDFTVNH